jgi:hypothetical protein
MQTYVAGWAAAKLRLDECLNVIMQWKHLIEGPASITERFIIGGNV